MAYEDAEGPHGLEVDPAALWWAGATAVPRIATAFAEIATRIHATERWQHSAYVQRSAPPSASAPEVNYGVEPAPVFAKWLQMRDLLNELAGRTANNLTDVGPVLCQIAWKYANVDTEARDVFDAEIADLLSSGSDTDPTDNDHDGHANIPQPAHGGPDADGVPERGPYAPLPGDPIPKQGDSVDPWMGTS